MVSVLVVFFAGAEPASRGVRVYHTGNSFHMRTVPLIAEVAEGAGVKGHTTVGTMLVGGSRAITLWDKPDQVNPAKQALRAGEIDVLTLCPWRQLPDPGIDKFVDLAVEHNPRVRVTIQQLWMAFDSPKAVNPEPGTSDADAKPTPWDAMTGEALRAIHADYFAALEQQIKAVNARHKRPVLLSVPTGRAVIALRERIRAGVPGVERQADLFTDRLGHPGPILAQLNAYCHHAVIYRQSPVGLPAPESIPGVRKADREPLARLLQELTWKAVIDDPLSGVPPTTRIGK